MENNVNTKRFAESNLYERIAKYAAEFTIKEMKNCGGYLNFDEVYKEFDRVKKQTGKIFNTDESVKHIYSKSEVRNEANNEADRRLELYTDYFNPYADGNISTEIGKYYAAVILGRIELWKRAVRMWYKVHRLSLPIQSIKICGIDEAELIVDFTSRQKSRNNLQKVIAKYINENILTDRRYTNSFSENDIEIAVESYIPRTNWDLSPFEEKMRKMLGIYEAWYYGLDDSYLYDKVNAAARDCENDFFRSGYIQDLTRSIFAAFIHSFNESEAQREIA